MDELKPCPCGKDDGTAVLISRLERPVQVRGDIYVVYCRWCGRSVPFVSVTPFSREDINDQAAVVWSTRAASGGLNEPFGNPEQFASLEQRARDALSGMIRSMAGIVNVTQTDAQFDADVLPRNPVMDAVAKMRQHWDELSKFITAALANQQGVGGALPAPARTREMEKDAGPFYAACQRACAELPNGWEIRVCLEKDAGTVELCDPDGGSSYMDVDADDRLTAEVHAAIDAAKATQPAGDVGREG